MIVDLQRFLDAERPFWQELEALVHQQQRRDAPRLQLPQVQRYHYLYQRAAADLMAFSHSPAEPALRQYLENLVASVYADVHESRRLPPRLQPLRWFLQDFPAAVRRRWRALALATAMITLGSIFGAAALALDPQAKPALMPFAHLQGNPSDRVASEQQARSQDPLAGSKATFATQLMTHNTRVSIFAMALGMTWGIGTLGVLFYNGAILGAVALDYVLAGESVFLLAWLLPHGAIEIPAVLIAGQAGIVLAGCLIGWDNDLPLRQRLRHARPDLMLLIAGVGIMLIWAGIIEAFLSQYHEPVLPYAAKIAFGVVELALLSVFLLRAGSGDAATAKSANGATIHA